MFWLRWTLLTKIRREMCVEAKPESSGSRLRTDKSFAFRQFDFEDSEGENELERLINSLKQLLIGDVKGLSVDVL